MAEKALTRNTPPRRVHDVALDAREGAETAIDLSKQNRSGTWVTSVRQSGGDVPKWEDQRPRRPIQSITWDPQ